MNSKRFSLHKVMRTTAIPALYLNKMISHKAWPLLLSKHVSCCWQCGTVFRNTPPRSQHRGSTNHARAEQRGLVPVQSPLLSALFLHPPSSSLQMDEVKC